MNWQEVFKLIYDINEANGWHEKRDIEEEKFMICSELFEGAEILRNGHSESEIWYEINPICSYNLCLNDEDTICSSVLDKSECPLTKPEGFVIDLVDFLIRYIDFIQVNYNDLTNSVISAIENESTQKFSNTIVMLQEVNKLISSDRFMDNQVAVSIVATKIRSLGYDPKELIVLKSEYNKTRGYKHGKKF